MSHFVASSRWELISTSAGSRFSGYDQATLGLTPACCDTLRPSYDREVFLNFQNWFRSRSTPTADWVSLCGDDLSYEGDRSGHRVWRFTDGDAVGIFLFTAKPDLPQTREIDRFISEYGGRVQAGGARLVECSIVELRGLPMLRTIVKVPQKPHGMTYLGSLTLPFTRSSYVVKVQCEERGMTGLREAVLLAEGLRSNSVAISPESETPIAGQWSPDSAEFDERFPQHPISRLRKHLQEIPGCLRLDDRLLVQERFGLPDPVPA